MGKYLLPLISLSRIRLRIDGEGVTTLVAAYGCPLRCRWCINSDILGENTRYERITVEELYERTKIDQLYFLATNGGLTFGGGESLLHADFIREFAKTYPLGWKINVETSLNVPWEQVEKIIGLVTGYIIDIKDMDNMRYQRYTGCGNEQVKKNLQQLIQLVDPSQIKIRVPLIANINSLQNQEETREELLKMGFRNIELFSYVNPVQRRADTVKKKER